MTSEERRTVAATALVLLAASLVRLGWEVRASPPVLPPSPVPSELVEATREAIALEERRRTPLAPGERLDPNRASEVELARLPGVGPALARRIVQAREATGGFHEAEALRSVTGIGAATLEKLRPHLEFPNPPSPPAGAGAGLGSGTGAVRLNQAGADELRTLPGVGPALAERILQRRREAGPFREVDELLEVPGIGPALLERIRPLVRVDP